jgi:hypothetical protein
VALVGLADGEVDAVFDPHPGIGQGAAQRGDDADPDGPDGPVGPVSAAGRQAQAEGEDGGGDWAGGSAQPEQGTVSFAGRRVAGA